jgi:hypothetical protein
MLPLVIDDRGGRHRGRPTPGHLSDAGLPPDSPRLPVVTPADCLTPASWKPTLDTALQIDPSLFVKGVFRGLAGARGEAIDCYRWRA